MSMYHALESAFIMSIILNHSPTSTNSKHHSSFAIQSHSPHPESYNASNLSRPTNTRVIHDPSPHYTCFPTRLTPGLEFPSDAAVEKEKRVIVIMILEDSCTIYRELRNSAVMIGGVKAEWNSGFRLSCCSILGKSIARVRQ